jgi:hypothetical protein
LDIPLAARSKDNKEKVGWNRMCISPPLSKNSHIALNLRMYSMDNLLPLATPVAKDCPVKEVNPCTEVANASSTSADADFMVIVLIRKEL